MEFNLDLTESKVLHVKQIREIAEWFGIETRNKYSIQDDRGLQIGYAAEQQKGFFGFLFRQFFGHWRSFDVHFFSRERELVLIGHHPFRWIFQRIELTDAQGSRMGAIQSRFAILSKKFDVENEHGQVILEVQSPIWRIWTFPFSKNGRRVAEVQKRWSGILSEAFTDRDNFRIEYFDPTLDAKERFLILVSAVFVDLIYFERKAGD